MKSKITVVGAGHVGATTAQLLVYKKLGDVVLVDIVEGMPQGKALDMLEAAPVEYSDCKITGTNSYDATKGSDIAVITAGLPRKPGMSRDDLLMANFDIVKKATEEVVKHSPNVTIVMVTNPLDVMSYVAYRISKFPRERVIGMAGILDTTRFRAFIAMELNVSVENIQALVLGGHGDSMVPLPRYATIAGRPITEILPQETIDKLVKRTREGGTEIVNFLKTGSAYYAPSSAAVEMVDAILNDRKKIVPCSALLQGEYGTKDVYVGVPVKLGSKGIEELIELKLTSEEKAMLDKSIADVKSQIQKLKF